jgi:sugar phosphate isomerase/epimerase
MKFVMFTKLLQELDVDKLADAIQGMGFDGFDLAVRPGFPINPENVRTALPAAAEKWAARGLTVAMVTTNFDFLDPSKPEVEPTLAACGEIGCREIKLGYWVHRGEDYWTRVEEIRKALAGFEKACARHNVRVSVHTHSGPYYGSNCAGVMHLVRGLDPRYIGAYIDPGHLAIGGEDLGLAFSMVRQYLCLIAVKSPGWFRKEEGGKVKWEHHIVPLREGMVNWRQVFEQAKLVGYDGVYTLHSEYENVTTDWIINQTREDLKYLKEVAAEVG